MSVDFEINSNITVIFAKKTKAPLQAGEIVRKWGTRWKKATVNQTGLYGVVKQVLNDDKVEVVVSGYFNANDLIDEKRIRDKCKK